MPKAAWFWSISNVPILLSSYSPGAKSLVPSKKVICNSVFSCWSKLSSALLEAKKLKESIPINLLAEPKEEPAIIFSLVSPVGLLFIKPKEPL